MGGWNIYSSSNGQVKAAVKKLEYNGEFMGERSVTATLYSPSPISLEIGDYITYRNEVFSIDYDPSVLKQARNDTYGQGYVYDSVKFNSRQMELVYCKFLDYVIADNQVHYSSLPNFSFYCETITNLTERIQANLNRLYTGGQSWTITVNTQNVHVGRINIDVQGMTCWDALGLISEKFESTFVIRGRNIVVAPSTDILTGLFQYGKGNGLRSIARTSDPSQGVVTRLRAMGNTTNMPYNYYRNKDTYVYAPITEVLGPYETSADIHTTYDFNNCFTVKAGTSADNQYRTKVSLDKTNWAPAIFSANAAWVGYSVASVMQLPGYDPVQYAAFMQQLNTGTYTKLYFESGISKDKWPSAYKEYTGTLGVTTGEDRLMLPTYPDVTTDPYIDSANISKYGVREESVIFDGSNGLDDIFPTIQGMTAEQARAAGATISLDSGDNGHLDEIVSATQIDDDGIPPVEGEESEMVETFSITLKDIGFNINDYFATDNAVISMRDGKCEGREFEITECVKSGNKYVLTCKRELDDSLNRYFPYDDYNLTAGDKFVLLQIEMPELYVDAAAQRLEDAAEAYLATIDHSIYTIEPKIDNIKAKRHDDEIESAGEGVKVYDTIYEGMLMQIEDEDLDIDDAIFIDRLTIKEGESLIPQYEVVLRNEKVKSSIQQIQQQITDIKSGVAGVSGNGTVDANQVNQLIKNYGDNRFLRKDIIDKLKQGVQVGETFVEGLFGEGGKFWVDGNGNTHVESDYMSVRKKFTATSVEIQDVHHIGGQQLLTAARMKCDSVERISGGWRCWFLAEDPDGYKVKNEWKVGDQAYVCTFNLEKQADGTLGNHFLWRAVTGVGTQEDRHYIDLSASVCAEASDAPMPEDNIVQLGYRGNDSPGRQSAIILAGADANNESPYIRLLGGINDFSLVGKTLDQLKPGDNYLTGVLKLIAGSTLADGRPINELGTEEGNLVRNSGFTGEYESEPTTSSLSVNADTPIYSDPFRYWDKSGDVVATTSSNTMSGIKAVLTGASISQDLGNIESGWYMLSFYAYPTQMSFSFAGQETTIPSNGAQRYEFPIELSGDIPNASISFIGDGELSDIMLTKGTISREWKPSVKDNDKAYAEFLERDYLYRAITDARTDILGGLVLTQLIKVGKFRNGEMNVETGGMSGLYNNDESPFIWGGGSLRKAFNTIAKYSENPNYNATDAEIANMAKFVVTHGGRAILNDIILRGYIHAVGGVFENVQSKNGTWKIDKDGNVTMSGAINANTGHIGGLTIAGSSIYAPTGSFDEGNSTDMTYLKDSEFHLYGPAAGKAYLSYEDANALAEFGLAVSNSNPYERIMCKLENTQSLGYTTQRKVGLYIDIVNTSNTEATFSQASDSGSTAIYIKRGHVTGLRRRVRYVTQNANGDKDDSIVNCHNTSDMTYWLPSGCENGQEIWLLPFLGNKVTVKPSGQDKLWRGGTDKTSEGIDCENRYYHIFIYCSYNGTWIFSSMSV